MHNITPLSSCCFEYSSPALRTVAAGKGRETIFAHNYNFNIKQCSYNSDEKPFPPKFINSVEFEAQKGNISLLKIIICY